MTWLAGIPVDELHWMTPNDTRRLDAVVCHRTCGSYAGDNATVPRPMQLSRGRVPSVHLLIGKQEGEWRQYYPYERLCNHAAGANGYAYGIEVSGGNGEPFTEWQLRATAHAVAQLHALGMPLDHKYNDGMRVAHWNGFLDHASVATSPAFEHSDAWNQDDWQTVSREAAPPDWPAIADAVAHANEERKEVGMGIATIPYAGELHTVQVASDSNGRWDGKAHYWGPPGGVTYTELLSRLNVHEELDPSLPVLWDVTGDVMTILLPTKYPGRIVRLRYDPARNWQSAVLVAK